MSRRSTSPSRLRGFGGNVLRVGPLFALLATAAPTATAAPRAIVAGGVGIPNLLHGHAEVFVSEAWAVELGGGVGLLPWTLTPGVRWSPEATCWGCWEGHGFRIAPGLTWFVFPEDMEEGLVTLNADLAWIWRSPSGWGTSLGVRLGAGAAYGQVADGLKIEPGIEIVPLQLGVMR